MVLSASPSPWPQSQHQLAALSVFLCGPVALTQHGGVGRAHGHPIFHPRSTSPQPPKSSFHPSLVCFSHCSIFETEAYAVPRTLISPENSYTYFKTQLGQCLF